MKWLILFRYHDRFDLCVRNIDLIKSLNPDNQIVGLYGGNPEGLPDEKFIQLFDHHYIVKSEDKYWKWKNGDLCIREWYKEQGKDIEFDMLHVIEWDLVLLDPISEVFSHMDAKSNGLTNMFTFEEALEFGWSWIDEDQDSEWLALVEEAESFGETLKNPHDLSFGIFVMATLCRPFLDKYASIYPSSYSNDEARVGLYTHLWGFSLEDANGTQSENDIVEADHADLDKLSMLDALENGAKRIHPVRSHEIYDLIEKVGK